MNDNRRYIWVKVIDNRRYIGVRVIDNRVYGRLQGYWGREVIIWDVGMKVSDNFGSHIRLNNKAHSFRMTDNKVSVIRVIIGVLIKWCFVIADF